MIKNKDIDFDYLGTDSILSPEVIDFIALKSTIRAKNKSFSFEFEGVNLDEYEKAMTG